MLYLRRLATRALLGLATACAPVAIVAGAVAANPAPAAAAVQAPRAGAHWTSCNDQAVQSAPKVLWTRIAEATSSHSNLPWSFWSNPNYRRDIVKIVCYESTYNWHADGGGQYGWYQMSRSLIASEGFSFSEYWSGLGPHPAGWFQCTAGELYILNRYGNPAAAWAHERTYGWY